MNVSRSTPRVRAMALAVVASIVLVAVSERPTLSEPVGTLVACTGLALVAVAALGRFWTSLFIAGRKDAELVRVGPYAACRHPLYLLSLVAMAGIGLATRSLVLCAALVLLAAALHARAMRAEDAWLEDAHGEAARRYRAEVPALLPDWSLYTVPESLPIQPRVAWKAAVDGGSLLLAATLVLLAHALHQQGILPTWLTLP